MRPLPLHTHTYTSTCSGRLVQVRAHAHSAAAHAYFDTLIARAADDFVVVHLQSEDGGLVTAHRLQALPGGYVPHLRRASGTRSGEGESE